MFHARTYVPLIKVYTKRPRTTPLFVSVLGFQKYWQVSETLDFVEDERGSFCMNF